MNAVTRKDLIEAVAAAEQRVRTEMQTKIDELVTKLHEVEIGIRSSNLHAARVIEARMRNLEVFAATSTARLAGLELTDTFRELDRRQ